MTKVFGLGVLGIGTLATIGAVRRVRARRKLEREIEEAELQEPVIVTEEAVVITEIAPVDLE